MSSALLPGLRCTKKSSSSGPTYSRINRTHEILWCSHELETTARLNPAWLSGNDRRRRVVDAGQPPLSAEPSACRDDSCILLLRRLAAFHYAAHLSSRVRRRVWRPDVSGGSRSRTDRSDHLLFDRLRAPLVARAPENPCLKLSQSLIVRNW